MNISLITGLIFASVVAAPIADASAPGGNPRVLLKTSIGDITIELFQEAAPITTKNFLKYVEDGFFNDTIFHRVIAGFVAQAGGFDTNMKQKSTRAPIKNESLNNKSNERGTLSMARTNAPHSATSQFYINLQDNLSLDSAAGRHGYAVFGKVSKGMDIIDKIGTVETTSRNGHGDVPVVPIVITRAYKL